MILPVPLHKPTAWCAIYHCVSSACRQVSQEFLHLPPGVTVVPPSPTKCLTMEAAAHLSSLTADSPLDDVISALSAAAAAAETSSESDAEALTSALLSAAPHLPSTGAGQKLSQLTAELAKHEDCRARLSAPEVVSRLVQELQNAGGNEEGSGGLVQPCRALGNLCYEGVPAREALLRPPGPEAMTAAVRRAVTAREDGVRAREVVSGLVLNFINDHQAGIDWVRTGRG